MLHLGHTYRDGPQHHRLAETLTKTRKQGFRTSAEVTNTNGSSSSSFSNIKRSCCCDDINLRANKSGCCTSSSSKPAATTNHQDPAGDATSSRHRGYKRGTREHARRRRNGTYHRTLQSSHVPLKHRHHIALTRSPACPSFSP